MNNLKIEQLKTMLKGVNKQDISLKLSNALHFEKHKFEVIVSILKNDDDNLFNFPILEFIYFHFENALKDFTQLEKELNLKGKILK
jgi:hypothetical protein